MSLVNSPFFLASSGAAVEEGQSLRFEDGDSAYLSFTPASAGNRRTYTWSGWVKRGNLTSYQRLFETTSTYSDSLILYNDDTLVFWGSDASTWLLQTNAVFRDPSAWYHIVVSVDTTQATASNRMKIYVNNELQSLLQSTYPSQNTDCLINNTQAHYLGTNSGTGQYLDGYLANVAFIDGQALDPTSFGEYNDTLWKPKSDTAIQSLTFGTNGWYLPFKQTTEAEGFSTVTYIGNASTHGIEGVGFEPDFVWIKERNGDAPHALFDSVRGVGKSLNSDRTNIEQTQTDSLTSFDSNGFTLGANNDAGPDINFTNGNKYVGWCWDAGTGSPVLNQNGSIDSTVKANTTNGFSIISFTGNATNGATIGHGLTSRPELVIFKNRDTARNWQVNYIDGTTRKTLYLNLTAASSTPSSQQTLPDNTVITLDAGNDSNESGDDIICYAFHSVSGYSDIGLYSGTGASNAINCGFKPAFVIIKATDDVESWVMMDNTRDPNIASITNNLLANTNNVENVVDADRIEVEFTSTGFTLKSTQSDSINNENGKNYIYMAFADTRNATFFNDTSGNNNNWTPNALNNTDVVPDSPVNGGNFATLNPLDSGGTTLKEGNLETSSSANGDVFSSQQVPNTGKWYFEFRTSDVGSGFVGVMEASYNKTNYTWGTSNARSKTLATTAHYPPTTDGSRTGIAMVDGDIGMCAIDMDDGKIWWGVNGTWASSGDPAAGTNQIYSDLLTYGQLPLRVHYGHSSVAASLNFNFGQDSSFAGNETPQGNTDDNGQGDFYYAPPTDFLALNTSNLPTPTITAPDEYFNTVLYTGTAASQSITGVGFQPDFLWTKQRNGTNTHALYDVVRTPPNVLYSSETNSEETNSGYVNQFDADGFTVGSANLSNASGGSYVAWNWLAGGTAVSNTSGSITSQVSANQDAGFSVVSYTGTGANATVGHGLSSAPEMIITKWRTGGTAQGWPVYHSSIGNTKYLSLNLTDAASTNSTLWNNTSPTSTNFSIGTNTWVNGNSWTYISYCFHSVEGYSKIASYTGNGSATDGVFVHCGFRPAFIIYKRATSTTTSHHWIMHDTLRDSYNEAIRQLYPNLSSAEGTTSANKIDILSNGFKLRGSDGASNASGQTYIFIAFAEAPFKSANAR